ncbi:MAG: periplasmic heavy metal sensor [Ignavibacteriales bacterium]|nr:periplasmic heavy metal sensor [Ignavibacteriales bacterium]MCF8316832.1 periplasmic heavy metal sensor [Ignavibacteriales bacterium]MCF8438408.1 periplasmic heavy metal sensor [Ignavibacteriales bacterium]
MNIFTEKKFTSILIILLVILNIGTITLLLLGRPEFPPAHPGDERPRDENRMIAGLLKMELDFSEEQIRDYFELRSTHSEQVSQLNREIRRLKKEMFDEVLADVSEPEISDSLLTLSQSKQNQVERLTFKHFLELKKICSPEQQTKLRRIFHRLFIPKPGSPG